MIAALLASAAVAAAQTVIRGDAIGDVYPPCVKGTYIELCVGENGVMGTELAALEDLPAGFATNPIDTGITFSGTRFGFVVDHQFDGFSNGSPPFSGDYFMPGNPEEAFGIVWPQGAEFNAGPVERFESDNIPGFLTFLRDSAQENVIVWEGGIADTFGLKQTVRFGEDDDYLAVTVEITNVSGGAISDIYYLRNMDPDQGDPHGLGVDTLNFVEYQPFNPAIDETDRSHPSIDLCMVAALVPSNTDMAVYKTVVAGDGCEVRCFHGGFDNRNAEEYHNTGVVSNTFDGTTTVTDFEDFSGENPKDADEGIGFTVKFDLAADETKLIHYFYFLNPDLSVIDANIEAAVAQSIGDPILVDFAGHRFIAGNQPNTDFLLYQKKESKETVIMRTNDIQGDDTGYFIASIRIARADCGVMTIAPAGPDSYQVKVDAPECFDDYYAIGDHGLVTYSTVNNGAIFFVQPHVGNGFAFLNFKILSPTHEFKTGCTGMLCQHIHEDILA